jgi:hypothetical protein
VKAIFLAAWVGFAVANGGMANAEAPGIGQWGVTENSDPITDKKIVDAGIGTPLGLLFKIECSGDKFGAVIAPYLNELKLEFITIDETSEVIWRIDRSPAVTEHWIVLPGKLDRAYALINTSPKALIAALMSGGDKLTIRTRGITDSFSLRGAASNIRQAMDACHYKPY